MRRVRLRKSSRWWKYGHGQYGDGLRDCGTVMGLKHPISDFHCTVRWDRSESQPCYRWEDLEPVEFKEYKL